MEWFKGLFRPRTSVFQELLAKQGEYAVASTEVAE